MVNEIQDSQDDNDDNQIQLTPLFPDTQNETARNLSKEDRAALMARLKQLLHAIRTGRFDPSEVASQKTCMDVSKLFPACFAHPEEQDEAFELLRNLMKASSDRLKECYVSPSSKRDDVTETMWLYDEGMQDDGKALQVVFSNTLWAVMAYLDSLEHGDLTLNHVKTATNASKHTFATALFPLFFRLLGTVEVKRLTPDSVKDMLEIIRSCTEGLKETNTLVLHSGLSALANVFAFSRDYSSCSLAYSIASKYIQATEEGNLKIAKALFPVNMYKGKFAERLQSEWVKLLKNPGILKKHTHDFLSLLAEASIKQPQLFSCLGRSIKVANYDLLLDAKSPAADGHPLAVLSSRTLSCQTVVSKESQVLHVELESLLSVKTSDIGYVTFTSSTIPRLGAAPFKAGLESTGPFEIIFRVDPEDMERLKNVLKYRYTPNLFTPPEPPRQLLTKLGKVSLSQDPVRARNTISPGSDDGPQKRDARAAEVVKNVEAGTPPETGTNGSHADDRPQDNRRRNSGEVADEARPPAEISERSKKTPSTRAVRPNSDKADGFRNGHGISAEDDSHVDADTNRNNVNTSIESASRSSSKRNVTVTVEIPSKRASPPARPEQPTIEVSVKKQAYRNETDTELSAISSGDEYEDSAPAKPKGKPANKAKQSEGVPKKKARDSGFDDVPPPKAKTVKRKASPASDNDGTDYDDLSKAGMKEKKTKSATPKRGRASARGRGRTSAMGKATTATATKSRPRKDSVDHVPPEEKDETEAPKSEQRVTRSKRTAAKAAAAKLKPAPEPDEQLDMSDTDELPARPAKRMKTRKIAENETKKASEDALDDFFDHRNPASKVAATKPNRAITNFSQLLDPKRNPLISAPAKQNLQTAVAEMATKTVTKRKEQEAVKERPSARKLRRETPTASESGNRTVVSPKAISVAFEELFEDLPPGRSPYGQETAKHYELPESHHNVDPDEGDQIMRNYTILYDGQAEQDEENANGNFFAEDNVDTQHAAAVEAPDLIGKDTLRDAQIARDSSLYASEVSQHPGRALSRASECSSIAAEADLLKAITGRAPEEDTSMEVDAIVAESYEERSRRSIGNGQDDGQGEEAQSHLTVETKTVRKERLVTVRARSEELVEPLNQERPAQKDAKTVPLESDSGTAPAAKRVSKGLVQVFAEAAQQDEALGSDVARQIRMSRRDKAVQQQCESAANDPATFSKTADKMFSPVKTSTPYKGYDEEYNQTQLLEDPLEVLEAQRAETRRLAEGKKKLEEQEMVKKQKRANEKRKAEEQKRLEEQKEAEARQQAEKDREAAEARKQVENKKKAGEAHRQADQHKKASEARKQAEQKQKAIQHLQAEEQEGIDLANRKAREEREVVEQQAIQPDKLEDLSVQLALLLVRNHRNSLNTYKASKSVGIDNIINIVATGCNEAERMDSDFLQGLADRNEEIHQAHVKATAPLDKLLERIKAESVKVKEEAARIEKSKGRMKVKLVPDLFSNFKAVKGT